VRSGDRQLRPRERGRSIPQEKIQLTEPQQIAALKKEIVGLHAEVREAWEEAKEATRAAENSEDREDEWLRERAHLRAKMSRRQLDALEKASHGIRIEAIRVLRSMLPEAKSQAKKGKAALLRLILRSTR
jgi:predicted phage gp36 major capsid-like protein